MQRRGLIKTPVELCDIVLTVCFGVFVYCWSDTSDGAIFGILGGIPDYGGNAIEIVPMGKWLFLFGFFFFMAGKGLAQRARIKMFTLYRKKSFCSWWNRYFFDAHLSNTILFIVSFFVWGVFCAARGESTENWGKIGITFYVHLSGMLSVLVLSDTVLRGKISVCLLIILEGMLYIFSQVYGLPFLAGGMYNRSRYYKTGGFSFPVYAVEIAVIAGCYLIVPALWKKGYLEWEEK